MTKRTGVSREQKTHAWQFRARFRRHAFGWKSSQPAIQRVREAVTEMKSVARTNLFVAAEGAMLLLEKKLSPALDKWTAHRARSERRSTTPLPNSCRSSRPAAPMRKTHDAWLERLWDAYQEDDIPYIEQLGDYWGELCASRIVASRWADQLIGTCRMAWSPDPKLRGFFKGTTHCLSSLFAADRCEKLLQLLEVAPYNMWAYRKFGVRALVALGRKAMPSSTPKRVKG